MCSIAASPNSALVKSSISSLSATKLSYNFWIFGSKLYLVVFFALGKRILVSDKGLMDFYFLLLSDLKEKSFIVLLSIMNDSDILGTLIEDKLELWNLSDLLSKDP